MNKKKNMPSACEKARQIIRKGGGMIKTSEAIQAGIHPRTLYQLRDMGDLVQISRGIYRLAEIEAVSNPDFVIVSTRIPISVICLISALSFHEITTMKFDHKKILSYAKICRVDKIVLPYLEANI